MRAERVSIKGLVDRTTRAGLELEYEGVSATKSWDNLSQQHKLPLWDSKHDGSLRPNDKNTELTFSKGLVGAQIITALNQLEALRDLKYRTSWRCSMHVHTDYSGLISDVPYRALIISSILEPILFAWAGPSRVESKFCSPTSFSVGHLLQHHTGINPKKYTAFNLAPLTHIGTAELRLADSTRDVGHMLDYINTGFELRRLGMVFESGWHILESMAQHATASSWIDAYMNPLLSEVLIPVAEETVDKVRWVEGFAPAAHMASAEASLNRYAI